MRHPPDNGGGRAPRPGLDTWTTPHPEATGSIIAQRRAAAARIAAQDRHLRISRWAHREMPLTTYYAHPRGGFYCRVVEGWRAA